MTMLMRDAEGDIRWSGAVEEREGRQNRRGGEAYGNDDVDDDKEKC